MTSLRYLAVDDDDLREVARYLPVTHVTLEDLEAAARGAARSHDMVVLHRADGRRVLKNSWDVGRTVPTGCCCVTRLAMRPADA